MGQRLVLDVYNGNEIVAKIYYHWSAYTGSAYQEIKELIHAIGDNPLQDIVQKISDQGGGIDMVFEDNLSAAQELFGSEFVAGLNDTPDRNCGLIALSENAKEQMDCWAEERAEIDLETKKFTNLVFNLYPDLDTYNEWTDSSLTPEDADSLPEPLYLGIDCYWDEIDKAAKEARTIMEQGGVFLWPDGRIGSAIF